MSSRSREAVHAAIVATLCRSAALSMTNRGLEKLARASSSALIDRPSSETGKDLSSVVTVRSVIDP